LLSGAHQSVLLEKGLAGPPGDPFHEPPIKRNLPATTDDTSQNQSFHAPLPKGHDMLSFEGMARRPSPFSLRRRARRVHPDVLVWGEQI
jgi:hypothetical protein